MSQFLVRRAAPALGGLAVLAGALRAIYGPVSPNYDAMWGLVWGRDLFAHGHLPDYAAAGSPSPRPLLTVVYGVATAIADVDGGLFVLGAVAYLAYALLLVAAVALATRTAGPAAGIVALALVVLAPPLAGRTAMGFQDVPFAALILTAAAIEAFGPRRWRIVLPLLTVAGLLRPEGWVFAGLYVVWAGWRCTNRQRVAMAGLAALAPATWMAADWLTMGSPVGTFTDVRGFAEVLGRRRGPAEFPGAMADHVRASIGGAVAIVGAGWSIAAARSRDPARRVVAATVGASFATLVLLAITGAPLNERYFFSFIAALAVAGAVAAVDLIRLAHRRAGTAWAIAATAAVAALLVVQAPDRIRQLETVPHLANYLGAFDEDLRGVLERLGERVPGDCPRVVVTPNTAIAPTALWLDVEPSDLELTDRRRGWPPGAALFVAPTPDAPYRHADALPPAEPPPGTRVLGRGRAFHVLARGCA